MNFRIEIERIEGKMNFDSFQFNEEQRDEIETFIHTLYKKWHPPAIASQLTKGDNE